MSIRLRPAGPLVLLLVALAGCGPDKPADLTPSGPELDTGKKMRLVDSLLNAGRTGEAVDVLEEAVASDPDNARLWLFYGQKFFNAGRLEQAEDGFKRALEIDAFLTDAQLWLGAVYQETSRFAEAEQQYRDAARNAAYPTPERIHLGLGKLYAKQGRLPQAEEELRMAVGINPKFYAGHFELAGILEQRGDLSEAVREYRVAEPGYRTSADFQYRLGLAYFRLSEPALAREYLTRAVDMAPGSPVAQKADDLLQMMR